MPSGTRAARIRFLTTEEGGRRTEPVSGIRSQIELGGFQSSCVVEDLTGRTELPLGESIEVRIRILFEDWAGAAFGQAETVELYEGNKLVATGEFLAAGLGSTLRVPLGDATSGTQDLYGKGLMHLVEVDADQAPDSIAGHGAVRDPSPECLNGHAEGLCRH